MRFVPPCFINLLITLKWLNNCSLYIEIPRPRIIQLAWISYYVGFWICYVSLSWWDQKCYAPLLRQMHSHVIYVKHPFRLYIDSMTKAFVNHVVMKLTVMYLIMISLKQPHTQTYCQYNGPGFWKRTRIAMNAVWPPWPLCDAILEPQLSNIWARLEPFYARTRSINETHTHTYIHTVI